MNNKKTPTWVYPGDISDVRLPRIFLYKYKKNKDSLSFGRTSAGIGCCFLGLYGTTYYLHNIELAAKKGGCSHLHINKRIFMNL